MKSNSSTLRRYFYLGLNTAARTVPVNGVPVLYYHSVLGESQGNARLEDYRDQMEYLRDQHYRVLALDRLVDSLGSDRFSGPSVALTFDDGFRSVFTHAFPVLRELGFTATVFLSTDYIGKKAVWDPSSGIYGADILDWQEIKEMHRCGISFGAHTCSHPDLTTLSPDQMADEMRKSKEQIEDKLGAPVDHMAYPYGCYNRTVEEVARSVGFTSGFTIRPGINKRGAHPFSLKRSGVFRNTDAEAFKCRLTHGYSWYFYGKRMLGKINGNKVPWE